MYSSCFEGLGSISEPYHIKIDESVVNLESYQMLYQTRYKTKIEKPV